MHYHLGDLGQVMNALRVTEGVRQRLLLVHDEDLREALLPLADPISDDMVMELVLREQMAIEAREYGAWGG